MNSHQRAYERFTQDPEWQETMTRYLAIEASVEVPANTAFVLRMVEIGNLYRIEKRYEDEELAK